MTLYILSIVFGLVALVWSADRFVDGASNLAKHYRMSPLLIGMIIIGFGTSAPELVVSTLASLQGNSGIALGNAYGSNITNIALILGATSLLMPISVHSQVLKKELPILLMVTILSIGLIYDLELSRFDAFLLLITFLVLILWTIKQAFNKNKDTLAKEIEIELGANKIELKKSYIFLFLGLLVLIISSRILVFGAVGIATLLGVSDVIIGLTVVAIGTSLPELASSIIAAKKGEPDIALGNVLGSNLFNTLAVVGIAGIINPLPIDKEILERDVLAMTLLTISIFILAFRFNTVGRINRFAGGTLSISYLAYIGYLISESITK